MKLFSKLSRLGEITFLFVCLHSLAFAQEYDKPENETYLEDTAKCVNLEILRQNDFKFEKKEKSAPDIIYVPSEKEYYAAFDIEYEVRLKNVCSEDIYFVTYSSSDLYTPYSYLLYRNGEDVWTPDGSGWRKKGIFTGPSFAWKVLQSGKSVDFRIIDSSSISKERAVAVYVQYCLGSNGIIEVISEPFIPIKVQKNKRSK